MSSEGHGWVLWCGKWYQGDSRGELKVFYFSAVFKFNDSLTIFLRLEFDRYLHCRWRCIAVVGSRSAVSTNPLWLIVGLIHFRFWRSGLAGFRLISVLGARHIWQSIVIQLWIALSRWFERSDSLKNNAVSCESLLLLFYTTHSFSHRINTILFTTFHLKQNTGRITRWLKNSAWTGRKNGGFKKPESEFCGRICIVYLIGWIPWGA